MLRAHPHRTSAVALLAATLLVSSGCGNRIDHETLRAEVTGVEVAPGGQGVATTTTGGAIEQPGAVATDPGTAQLAGPAADAVAPAGTAGAKAGPAGAKPGVAASVPTASGAAGAVCTKQLSPIKIGSVGETSGVMGSVVGAGTKVLQAWVQSVNAKGGLNCHPVEVFVADDGGDPSAHQSLVQRFVEQNGVVAFVFLNAPFAGEAGVKYLKDKGIPVIGSEGASDWFNENPNYFPQMSTGSQYIEASLAMGGQSFVPKGLTKLATLTCIEAPLCSSAYGYVGELAKKYGMELVYRGQVSITQPNYTSACLQAKNAGAQIVFTALDGNSDQRLVRDCQSVGFQPKIITPAVGITPTQAAAPVLAGIQVATVVSPWFNTSVKAVAEYVEAVSKYGAGLDPNVVGTVGVQAWTAAQVFAFAVGKSGPDVTSKSILEGLFQVKNNTFGGLTQPLTYKANAPSHIQRLCWWAAEFNGPKITSPNGGKMTCD